MALSVKEFTRLGLLSVGWFFLRLEEGIILGLMVTDTCLFPGGSYKHLSIFAFISTVSVSKLLYKDPSFGLGLTLSTVAEPCLHLEWPFPNTVTS